MTSKKEIMSDLKFCKELMDRLVEYADKNLLDERVWRTNHTVVQDDIVKLRRKLMAVSHKLDC